MAMLLPDPFEALFRLQQGLDAFRSSNWLEPGPSAGGAYPPLNVFRKGDDLVLVTEVPGINKADLDVQVKGRTLRISGTKSVNYPEQASLHRRERLAGRFDRAVTLPMTIDAEGVSAECQDGILVLLLPRAEQDKPKSISIQ
jgi:HSP20 family protein